ncbi:MAG: Transcriptional regulator, LacI family, partial [uncultured Nocardioidaceae bacterium]
ARRCRTSRRLTPHRLERRQRLPPRQPRDPATGPVGTRRAGLRGQCSRSEPQVGTHRDDRAGPARAALAVLRRARGRGGAGGRPPPPHRAHRGDRGSPRPRAPGLEGRQEAPHRRRADEPDGPHRGARAPVPSGLPARDARRERAGEHLRPRGGRQLRRRPGRRRAPRRHRPAPRRRPGVQRPVPGGRPAPRGLCGGARPRRPGAALLDPYARLGPAQRRRGGARLGQVRAAAARRGLRLQRHARGGRDAGVAAPRDQRPGRGRRRRHRRHRRGRLPDPLAHDGRPGPPGARRAGAHPPRGPDGGDEDLRPSPARPPGVVPVPPRGPRVHGRNL